jgi:hypothetical protein
MQSLKVKHIQQKYLKPVNPTQNVSRKRTKKNISNRKRSKKHIGGSSDYLILENPYEPSPKIFPEKLKPRSTNNAYYRGFGYFFTHNNKKIMIKKNLYKQYRTLPLEILKQKLEIHEHKMNIYLRNKVAYNDKWNQYLEKLADKQREKVRVLEALIDEYEFHYKFHDNNTSV